MSKDIIYREDAMNLLWYFQDECCSAVVGDFEKLPSADRPQGEWIDVNGDGSLWRCDQCKDTACCKGNFCPNCGARMKGADDD